MEWTKFISYLIQHCISEDLKKTSTKRYISEQLDKYGMEHIWEGDTLIIDGVKFKLNFNSNNLCRGYSRSKL